MFKKVVRLLKDTNKKVSTMESCTGGGLADAITNIEGASNVIEFSAVTYSNDFKIKMGVSEKNIAKYSVYSMNIAKEMSKKITDFTGSDYGIGITGKLNCIDKKNLYGNDSVVFISIYQKEDDKYYTSIVSTILNSRKANKKLVIKEVEKLFLTVLEKE